MKKNLVISLLILSALITSCGGGKTGVDQPTGQSSDQPSDSTETSAAETTGYSDDLPSDLNFDGKELRVLSSLLYAGKSAAFHASVLGESTGDVLDDAIYERNLNIMERFGITIKEEELPFNRAVDLANRILKSDEDVYDLISLTDRDSLSLASDGLFYFIEDVSNVNLKKPYWNSSINADMTIGGHQILAYSDVVLTSYDSTHVLLFNKKLAEDLSLGDIYALVENGKWTLDVFAEMGRTATTDLDGDSEMGDDDRYGWIAAPKQIAPLIWIGGGAKSITKDSNDIPVFTMNNERMIDLLNAAYKLTWGGDSIWYRNNVNGVDVKEPALFANGRGLFATVTFEQLFQTYYRDLTFDYGIIPYPKYDENQENYCTRVEFGFPYMVPITLSDTSFSGAMLEALACESKNKVIPAYYEIALKTKYTHDDVSGRILDMMMENRVYDLGDTFFTTKVRDGFVGQAMGNGKEITASLIEKNAPTVEGAIQKVVEATKK